MHSKVRIYHPSPFDRVVIIRQVQVVDPSTGNSWGSFKTCPGVRLDIGSGSVRWGFLLGAWSWNAHRGAFHDFGG